MTRPDKTVLAIDPGSVKCGLAVVARDPDGKIEPVCREIAPADELVAAAERALNAHPVSLIVVGSGTTSAGVVERIRERFPATAVLLVDERDTTLDARARYWEHHRRRGWRRFVPATLQLPPEPIDDFVAVILAERVLSEL